MSVTAEKKIDTSLSIVTGVFGAIVVTTQTTYIFYWLTGGWLPLLPFAAIAISTFVAAASNSVDNQARGTRHPMRTAELVSVVWTILWLATYAPHIHFPLLPQ